MPLLQSSLDISIISSSLFIGLFTSRSNSYSLGFIKKGEASIPSRSASPSASKTHFCSFSFKCLMILLYVSLGAPGGRLPPKTQKDGSSLASSIILIKPSRLSALTLGPGMLILVWVRSDKSVMITLILVSPIISMTLKSILSRSNKSLIIYPAQPPIMANALVWPPNSLTTRETLMPFAPGSLVICLARIASSLTSLSIVICWSIDGLSVIV